MTTGLRFFYRHLHVTGLENIPAQGPVIIVANHHSSLMDAALLGILLKRKAYFFARGDVFVNPFVKKILWWLHMLPVHPHAEGRRTIGANDESFLAGQKILAANGLIVFFPESISHTEHRLLEFRKGVFRLAFATISEMPANSDIAIVPAGIVYDHPRRCRHDAQVHIGTRRYLSSYLDEWRTRPAAALLHISKDLRAAVEVKMLHVEDPLRCNATNYLLEILRNGNAEHTSGWIIHSSQKLANEQAICSTINKMDAPSWRTKSDCAESYFLSLGEKRINDMVVSNRPSSMRANAVLWMGYPLYLVGLLCQGLPLMIARNIVDKKVYRPDFYSWIFVACYSLLYFCWVTGSLIITVAIGGWYGLAIWLVALGAGLFALYWSRKLGWVKVVKNWQQLSTADKENFIQQRASLI